MEFLIKSGFVDFYFLTKTIYVTIIVTYMQTSSQFIIAVHILALLEIYKDEQPLSSKFIAASVNTNPVVIRKLLSVLSKAKMIKAQHGSKGGSFLNRPIKDISLIDIYHLTESGNLFALHPNRPNQLCPCGRHIQPIMIPIFEEAENAIGEILKKSSIEDVVTNIKKCLEKER